MNMIAMFSPKGISQVFFLNISIIGIGKWVAIIIKLFFPKYSIGLHLATTVFAIMIIENEVDNAKYQKSTTLFPISDLFNSTLPLYLQKQILITIIIKHNRE